MYPNFDCRSCADCTPTQTVITPVNCAGGTPCLDFIGTTCVVYQGAPFACGAITIATGEILTSVLTKVLTALCAGGFTGATGPQGPPGPSVTGPTGPTGPSGTNGVTPSITIANTFNGAPGTNALVALAVGSTLTNVLLDVTIPRGNPGVNGTNGIGIGSVVVNGSGHLIITKTDSTVIDAGSVLGPQGLPGTNGIDGVDGRAGSNSLYYVNGILTSGTLGRGRLEINSQTLSAVTQIKISDTSMQQGSPTLFPLGQALSWVSTPGINDYLQIYDTTDPTVFGIYKITAKLAEPSVHGIKFTVIPITTNGVSAISKEFATSYLLMGKDGLAGTPGINGSYVSGALINGIGDLIITLSDSTVYNAGSILYDFGSGTLNTVAKWTPDGMHLGDSLIRDNGNAVAVGIAALSTFNFFKVESSTHIGAGWFRTTAVNSTPGFSSVGVKGTASGIGTVNANIGVSGYASNNALLNIGTQGIADFVSTTATNIGGEFQALNGLNNYPLRIVAPAFDANSKLLMAKTADGSADWGTINDLSQAVVDPNSDYLMFYHAATTLHSKVLISDLVDVTLQKEITSNYTLTNADYDYTIFINNGTTPITITLGTITKANFCVGFIQEGSADVTFAGTGLSNPVGLKSKGQGYQTFIERKLATSTYYLLGNTKA